MIILSNTKKPIDFSQRTGIPNSSGFWRFGKRPIPIDKIVLIEKKRMVWYQEKDLVKIGKYWPELKWC